MKVRVRLHTILRRQTAQGIVDRLDLELEPNASVQSVLDRLAIGLESDRILIVVNGRVVAIGHILADGDEVRLIPAVSGGSCGAKTRVSQHVITGASDRGD
jgi:molybdopterin converting factor small subunit